MTRQTVRRTYALPLLMAIVTIASLVTGLLAVGLFDILAVIALAAVPGYCLLRLFARK
ncbi:MULTISPECIES: hypothetical protein [unclassified Sphingopyxis]|uniref:hypothetical protein n=1 Tax=unclassified Sphingopyxis TaxID=2614943 RepID=UPI000A708622|nr:MULTISPECIES: hypothetical protein [unclassified Sphingopyxis]